MKIMCLFFLFPVALALLAGVLFSSFPFYVFQTPTDQQFTPRTHHLVVYVPGFMAPKWHHGFWVNNLASDEVYVYCATSGYGLHNTSRSLQMQGFNLAREIDAFVRNTPASVTFTHLSFIGSSLGGVVAQYALLADFKWNANYHAFITLNSPHNGAPHRDTWVWQTLAGYFQAHELHVQMTWKRAPHRLDKVTALFPIVTLIATEHDGTVDGASAWALADVDAPQANRVFFQSQHWADQWFNTFAHTFATMRPDVVYGIRQLINLPEKMPIVSNDSQLKFEKAKQSLVRLLRSMDESGVDVAVKR